MQPDASCLHMSIDTILATVKHVQDTMRVSSLQAHRCCHCTAAGNPACDS